VKSNSIGNAFLALAMSAFSQFAWASPLDAKLAVNTSPTFFNPSIGRSAKIHIETTSPGHVVLEITDRDRFLIRSLGPVELASSVDIAWDGKDESGTVVPNEVYSIRVRFEDIDGRTEIYDPAAAAMPEPISIEEFSYSRVDGVLNFRLENPSRVHIQAGQLGQNKTPSLEGPILKTVVDREPRVAGAISEQWSGFDDSRLIYVPDLPGFVVAILASPLPANSLIASGNRKENFASYAARTRPPQAVIKERKNLMAHNHHLGLTALEDRSPRLSAQILSAKDADPWQVGSRSEMKVLIGLDRELEPVFLARSARLHIFCDATLIATQSCERNPCPVEISPGALPVGRHRFVANWDSGLGPVGVAVKIMEIK
jgi:hypothetical protein